jgi:broad specificity phosphatase PhoE
MVIIEMLEILLIRHGETAWNAAEIFRGRISIGLSEDGLKQVEKLAEYLRQKKISAVFCSPLKRALETAEPLARQHELSARPVDGLTDLDFGKWEGQSIEIVKTQYKEIYELWRERPDLAKIPDGESLQEARQRSLNALNKIIADCKQGTIVIVTHRVITKLLECALLGLDDSHFWNIEQDTGGVTTFLYNGRIFVLKYHNDISFLKNH